ELVERATYQAYGSAESDYRPERWKGFREDYGFTGKEEDVEVGPTYFGFRYLSTPLGRWVSADPKTTHQVDADLNAYVYVGGRVLSRGDAVGLDWTDDISKSRFIQGVSRAVDDIVHAPLAAYEAAKGVATGQIAIADAAAALGVGALEALPPVQTGMALGAASSPELDDAAVAEHSTNVVFGVATLGAGVAVRAVLRGAKALRTAARLRKAPPAPKPPVPVEVPPPLKPSPPRDVSGPNCEGTACSAPPKAACFAAGTAVATPGGLVAIEEVREGDIVHSMRDDGVVEPARVLALTVRHGVEVIELWVQDIEGRSEQLVVTTDHPFLVEGVGWLRADSLLHLESDRLHRLDGTFATVLARGPPRARRATVYNLEVEKNHNYFVGSTTVLVHNCGEPAQAEAPAPAPGGTAREAATGPSRGTGGPIVHPGRQGKHTPGHNNFIPGRSEFTHPDPQALLDKWAGKGVRHGAKEVVDFVEEIGTYVKQDGTRVPTSRGRIHYDVKNRAHIVPAAPGRRT
ncbi:MAG: hypothetical protein IT371_15410, partial [Deltaproteobacteria bacterium]|nr:hypothetical protein [Deltaproteobacteria bacterium]